MRILRACGRLAVACAAAIAVSTGCRHDRTQTGGVDAAPVQNDVEITAGKTTPEGRLIFFEWDTREGGHHRQAALIGDYGMMVFYDHFADEPKPIRFELYIQETRQIIRTTSLGAFIAQLDRLPEGATLDWYNTCTAGTHYRLPDEITRAIRDACTERGIVLRKGSEPGLTICTCP